MCFDMNNKVKVMLLLPLVLVGMAACKKRDLNTKVSNTTGWAYNDPTTTKFQALEGDQTGIPIGMVAIQGGQFEVNQSLEFITAPRDVAKRTVSVSSFFMDKYEITNLNWREYIQWMEVVFGTNANKDVRDFVRIALPDTTVWREELAYNEPYVQNYLRHPAFSFYPVVGVTWEQANAYCTWRTDRVNEMNLVRAGIIQMPDFRELEPMPKSESGEEKDQWEDSHHNKYDQPYVLDLVMIPDPDSANHLIEAWRVPYEYIRDKFVFNSEKYLYDGTYVPMPGNTPRTDFDNNPRKANRADGLMVIGYRLPTEEEWMFAAYAPVAGEDGLTIEGRSYPWSGYHPRNVKPGKKQGYMQANFVRGRGDMMGVSGALNDKYVITCEVDEFWPNDFGLYNMAGNVNEWVMDVYRELSNQSVVEYNSFRGNVYTKPMLDEEGNVVLDSLGRVMMIEEDSAADKRNFKDGDFQSVFVTDFPLLQNVDTATALAMSGQLNYKDIKVDPSDVLAPKITDKSRVYKGGSWRDRVYWLNPSTRRYLDQDKCSNTIGFRCAMSTVGNQVGSGRVN